MKYIKNPFYKDENIQHKKNFDANCLIDKQFNSEITFIAFSGLYRDFNSPTLEFIKSTQDIPVNKIYLKDCYCSWYFYGVPGVGKTIDKICGFLREKTLEAKKIITIGNSGGGFAALLFGSLLEATEIHAFSPQTFLSSSLRKKYKENRWPDHFKKLIHPKKVRFINKKYLDINNVLQNKTKYFIYFGTRSRDTYHIQHLKKMKNIIIDKRGESHSLVKEFKSTGELNKILWSIYSRMNKI